DSRQYYFGIVYGVGISYFGEHEGAASIDEAEGHRIEVDSIAGAKNGALAPRPPCETDAGREVVAIGTDQCPIRQAGAGSSDDGQVVFRIERTDLAQRAVGYDDAAGLEVEGRDVTVILLPGRVVL